MIRPFIIGQQYLDFLVVPTIAQNVALVSNFKVCSHFLHIKGSLPPTAYLAQETFESANSHLQYAYELNLSYRGSEMLQTLRYSALVN